MKDETPSNGDLHLPPAPATLKGGAGPSAASLGTPLGFRRGPGQSPPDSTSSEPPPTDDATTAQPQGPRKQATETIAQRAGALSDEVDFPAFVASLVHGTFDAIVDTSIRQMESYASLVSAVAKSVDQFTADSVTLNQARDWLVEQYPEDLRLDLT